MTCHKTIKAVDANPRRSVSIAPALQAGQTLALARADGIGETIAERPLALHSGE